MQPTGQDPPVGIDAAVTALSENDLDRIYAELRRHAQSLLSDERTAHTLQATALVNEAMVKLLTEFCDKPIALPPETAPSDRRKALFAMISLRMRQVLVEHARHRNAQKRSGQWTRSPLHHAMAAVEREGVDLVALDQALGELQAADADAATVFQHRWFGGLSMEHIATVLDITRGEAQQRWNRARRALQIIMARDRQ
ncbi:MAG: ECF-type sigma factor [Phycisphaerales bacterium]